MEEKNQNEVVAENAITDDTEIDVGMIEKSILFDKEQHKEQYVWLLKGSIWKTYSFSKILDLIHRLQGKVAEYERLLDDGELVSIDWHNEQVLHLEEKLERYGHRLSETQYALSVCQDENAVQKGEIERLTEENAIIKGNPPMIVGRSLGKTIRAKLLAFDKMKERNAELQKQVDEFTDELATYIRKAKYYYDNCKAYGIENFYDSDLEVD